MAGCGSPLSALDCGRHCFCGVWDAVAGSQAGPRGGAPRSVPCVAGYRTGTCRATLLDPRGPSEGRLRGSLDRACGFHTPPPRLETGTQADPGRRQAGQGRPSPCRGCPQGPLRGPQAWVLALSLQRCWLDGRGWRGSRPQGHGFERDGPAAAPGALCWRRDVHRCNGGGQAPQFGLAASPTHSREKRAPQPCSHAACLRLPARSEQPDRRTEPA